MLRHGLFTLALMGSAAPVLAGDTPLYQPVPAWVKEAPAPDPAKLPTPRPQLLIFDQQQRIEGGRLSNYVRAANVIANPAMLNEAGTIRLDWQPDHGDVIVHHARLLRAGETIDLLAKGERFNVLKRELGLEQRMLTGILTASMEVEGARVGDVLDVAYTVTVADPVLKGNVAAQMPLVTRPVTAGLARNRISWSKDVDVRLRSYLDGVVVEPKLVGDYREVELTGPAPKPAELPNDAPLRFRPIPMVEASSFADWGAVSTTFAPLYATEGAIPAGGPLAAEVARIRAAGKTPRERAALALQSVQGEVRYLFKGMAGGNYTPQSPQRTWEVRYGDCKAKTLLLLAMLRDMGIEAEPVLASIEGGDLVPKRLPGAGAFDHVLVRARIDGRDLWLDGTGQGARLADIDDTPPFRWVLPLRTAGADLMPLPMHANARPNMEVAVEVDQRAGIALPTPLVVTVTMRGQGAEAMRLAQAAGTDEQVEAMANAMLGGSSEGARAVSHQLSFDDAANTATMRVEGFANPGWNFANGRYRRDLDVPVSRATFEPDRSRTAWKTIPVATPAPETTVVRVKLILPDGGKGYALEGSETLPETLGGLTLSRHTTMAGGVIEIEDRVATTGAEVPADQVSAARTAMAAAKARLLRVVAPAGLPVAAVARRDALKAGRLKALIALYDKSAADAEADDPTAWDTRASFRGAVGDYAGALADIDRAIAIEGNGDRLAIRYRLLRKLKRDDEAVKTAQSAFEIDSTIGYAGLYAGALAEAGRYDEALELLDPRIAAGGDEGRAALVTRADVMARRGDAGEAVPPLDRAIADKPNDPDLYNSRCWTRATLNVDNDAALADCDRAIALGISTAAALDSRAMVHFRAGRLDKARADLDEALGLAPGMAAALYLRGVVRQRQGDAKGAAADLEAARLTAPRIDEDYVRWGVTA